MLMQLNATSGSSRCRDAAGERLRAYGGPFSSLVQPKTGWEDLYFFILPFQQFYQMPAETN